MAFQLKELDGQLGEILVSITSPKPMVLLKEREHDYQIWVEPDFLYIQDLNINIFSGEYCKYSKETGDYEVDHDVYYIFTRTGRLIYSEYGSSLEVCVRNFMREVGKDLGGVGELLCTYALDNGKFIKEKVLKKEK